jgi:hypothetical protein
MSADIIQKMFEHTTQYAQLPTGTMLKKAFRSPHPALNVYRRNEDVGCDIVYCDVPAIFDASTAAVLFFGTSSKVTNVHGIKHDNQFANTLEDTIIQRGAPNCLLSDRGQAIIRHKVEDILLTFCIGKWQSEPHQHHQNPAERRYHTVKKATNRILDRTGAPAHLWLLCLQYFCYILNHTYNMTIYAVLLTKLLGSTVDICPLLRFHSWYYHQSETSVPSDSKEGLGNIVGISEHFGHALTYKILTADTGHVIYRSLLRPVTTSDADLRASMFVGEKDTQNEILKSRDDFSNVKNMDEYKLADTPLPSLVFNPQDLIGWSFLMDEQPDGQKTRGKLYSSLKIMSHYLRITQA